jgi:glycosyltransferase involved in cell wall biosynthesis
MNVPVNGRIELLIVDNASTDNTRSVIDSVFKEGQKFDVRTLFEPALGKTHALNNALSNASGDILVFIDDDHIVTEDFIIAINQAVREFPDFTLFCGRLLPNWDGSEPQWLHDNEVYPIRPYPFPYYDQGDKIIEIKLDDSLFLPQGGNLVIRKTVIQKIGLFSKKLGPKGHNLGGGEDMEFIRRALHHGERLLFVPRVLQYHQVHWARLTLPYLVKKAYLRSKVACELNEGPSVQRIGTVPLYLFGQAVDRFIKALFAVNKDARRYYLVKLAVTLGEMQGIRKSKNQNS